MATSRTYRGLGEAARREDRRRRLLDAALELFGTRGYREVTIAEVCAQAGVTARHLYEAFGGREGLLEALYDDVVRTHLEGVAAALDPDAPLEDAVRSALRASIEPWTTDERRARVAFVEVVGVLEAKRIRVLDRYADALAAYLDALADRERLERRDFTLAAQAIVGATTQLVLTWVHRPKRRRPPVAALEDELAGLALAALRSAADDGLRPGRPPA